MAVVLADGTIRFDDGQTLMAGQPISGQQYIELARILPDINPALRQGIGWPVGGGGSAGLGIFGPVGVAGVPTPAPPGAVTGGSGAVYPSITAAQAGETEDVILGNVPQAGTGPGVLVGPGTLSAVDGAFKDYFVVNTSLLDSGNYMMAQWARVSDYVGATRTLTLDRPINFVGEATFALIRPIRLWLNLDVDENVVFTKNVELNLEGHRLRGTMDQTGGIFFWLRGAGGFVTNGVQKTNLGVLRLSDCWVSRRDTTIYALLLTEGSNVGRCEVENVKFGGCYAARRGLMGWRIFNCTSYGEPTSSNYDDLPARLMESPTGIAVVPSSLEVEFDTEFSGAVYYAEQSLNDGGGSGFFVTGRVRLPNPPFAASNSPAVQNFNFIKAVGGAMVAITKNSLSQFNVAVVSGTYEVGLSTNAPVINLMCAESFTGTMSFTDLAGQFGKATLTVLGGAVVSAVAVEGNSNTTGTITMGGIGQAWTVDAESSKVFLVRLGGTLGETGRLTTGTVTLNSSVIIFGGDVAGVAFLVDYTSGTPSVTIAGTTAVQYGRRFRYMDTSSLNGPRSVSIGTYTWSGMVVAQVMSPMLLQVLSGVTGGTWTVSGEVNAILSLSDLTSITVFSMAALGTASLTFSGRISVTKPDMGPAVGGAPFTLVSMFPTSGSPALTLSGQVDVDFVAITFGGSAPFISANGSGGSTPTLLVTGSVSLFSCLFSGVLNTVRFLESLGTATVLGPSTVEFRHCHLVALTMTSGAGTITWTGATLRLEHCFLEGNFTVNGTFFSTIEAFHSRFEGISGNNSITFSGTRPATYRYWKCSFRAREDAAGTPEVVDDYATYPASGALTAGDLETVNASGQATPVVAGTTAVEGVLLIATTVLGNASLLVRRGKMQVKSNAAVANGDTTNADTAGTPTSQITGAPVVGKRIGRALEATGATVAGKAYTAVNLM